MATPALTAAQRQAELKMKLQNNLTEVEFEAYKSALGLSIKGQSDLSKERARRGTKITEAIANYERALNSGLPAAKAKALVDLTRIELEMPLKFAAAAYAPNNAVISAVNQVVPPDLMRAGTAEATAAAKRAWQTFFMLPGSRDGNMLGTYRAMVEIYGEPKTDYYGPNEGRIAEAARDYFAVKQTAEQNALNFEAQMNTARLVTDSWDTFLAKTGLNSEDPQTLELFLNERKDLAAMLPTESAPFIGQLRQMVQNPEANKAFFSDIDAQIQSFAEKEDEYLGYLRGEGGAETQRKRTDLEKLVGWLQRSDVQAWAKEWGMNLGTVQPVTPEIQKLIDAGQIPKESLVNGMLYTPAPDDMRAARLALRQLERDPQKNVLYQMGLTRQAGPRTVVEIEEIVTPAGVRPKGVETRTVTGKDGKPARIVKLDDGSYAIAPAEKGATYARLSAQDGAKLFDAAPADTAKKFDEPVELNGIEGTPAQTRTRRLQAQGPEYSRDPTGAQRGIDLDTGEMVVIAPEKIASREVTHLGTKGKTLGERFLERRAAVTKKKAGIDISEEAINEMDIGPEASKKQIEQSNKEYREAAEGAMEDAAERADAKAAAAQPAPAPAAKAPATDSLLKRMFGKAPEPTTPEEREAAMQTKYRSVPKAQEPPKAQGLPTIPTSTLDERLQRVPSSMEMLEEDVRAAKMASPGESVVPPATLFSTDEQKLAAQRAAENEMFDKALVPADEEGQETKTEDQMFDAALSSFPTKPKGPPKPKPPQLSVESPAPGIIPPGLLSPTPKLNLPPIKGGTVGTTTGAEIEAEAPAQKTAFFRRRAAALQQARSQQSGPGSPQVPEAPQ